ncbi:MAG: HAD family hydrolase [Candidatus Thorarchaeota archaeon]
MTLPSPLLSYDAVIFDLDGTLVDTKQFPIVASKYMFQKLGLTSEVMFQQYLQALVAAYFQQIDEVVGGAPYKTPYHIIRSAVATGLRVIGLDVADDLLDAVADEFSRLHIELPVLFPGTLDLLTTLKVHGIKMGVITNSFEGHPEIILRRLGVHEFFTVMVDGGDVHTYKPDPRPFEYALEMLEVDKSSALMVGDEYYADIVGAYNARIASVWINMHDDPLDRFLGQYGKDTAPKVIVNSISGLLGDLA